MWYIPIIAGIALTFIAYRKRRSIHRMGADEVSDIGRIMGTDFGVAFFGCITLAVILCSILFSNPGTEQLKSQLKQDEVAAYEELGRVLGNHIGAAVKDGKAEGKALVIDRETGPDGKVYHEAFMKGLEKGFRGRVSVSKVHKLPAHPKVKNPAYAQTEYFWLRNEVLDALAKQYPDCNVVISLVPFEDQYSSSRVASAAQSKEMYVGVYTGNPYLLGAAISTRQITTCIVPDPDFVNDGKPAETVPEDLFSQRYIMLNHKNIGSVVRKYKRLLHVTKRID